MEIRKLKVKAFYIPKERPYPDSVQSPLNLMEISCAIAAVKLADFHYSLLGEYELDPGHLGEKVHVSTIGVPPDARS